MLDFKRETINETNISVLEKLRFDAYGMLDIDISHNETFFANELRNNKYLVYSAYLDNELVSACYISNFHHSIYIEQLFVKKSFQNTGLNIGKKLLSYVLADKEYIENHFNESYYYSYLGIRSSKLDGYYKKLGYKKVDDNYMKKTI